MQAEQFGWDDVTEPGTWVRREPREGVDYDREAGDGFWHVDRIKDVGDGVEVKLTQTLERWRFKDGSVVDVGGLWTAVRLTGEDLCALNDAMLLAVKKQEERE